MYRLLSSCRVFEIASILSSKKIDFKKISSWDVNKSASNKNFKEVLSTLGGVFSRGGVAVLLPVAMNIGRFLGPPLARAVLAGSGREAYAHVQVRAPRIFWARNEVQK